VTWPPRLSEHHHGFGGWAGSAMRPALRRQVGSPCAYCLTPMARSGKLRTTRDHVFPKHKGFRLSDLNGLNKAFVCEPCNVSKKGFDIVEWWWRLKGGNDRRAQIVLEVIRKIWLAGVLPDGEGKHFDAVRDALQRT
jgi:hypothetical protein